jgi:pimeloyl-ACP methyl ester carboxylesterase
MGAAVGSILLAAPSTSSLGQTPTVRTVAEKALREYAGVYQWGRDAFLYLQLWSELTGTNQLVALDESGDVRALYSTGPDQFFAGPGAAIPTTIESSIRFQRDSAGRIISLTWRRGSGPQRLARRVEIEKHEDVHFSNGAVRLAGTLMTPSTQGKYPVIILVHASGAEDREYLLPFARFLIRHGIGVLGYDKRGVGGSTGDWRTASFEDLAGDVVAAFEYLKTRGDVDRAQIGLLGWSQAGWVMPLAAVRANDIAFLISISGAGIPAAETTIDQARNEMTMRGMKPQTVDQIVGLMKLQYHFASTGRDWEKYTAARDTLITRLGRAPETFPGSLADPYWGFIRRQYFYDPAPTLRRLRVPTLALFGALDNNILPEKNHAAWESALRTSGNRDYTLRILPSANHLLLEAKVGSNSEMASLQRFVPGYALTVREWLATRVRGLQPITSVARLRTLPSTPQTEIDRPSRQGS